MESIGIIKVDTGVGSGGVGWLVVPDEVDREKYIEDCYRTQTVSINGGEGYGFYNNVKCPQNVLENLIFPTEENRGTPVIWVRDGISHLPLITGWLRKEGDYYALGENQWRVTKNSDTASVELFVDGTKANFQINIVGDENNPAEIDVKLSSKNQDSKFNLTSDNEVNLVGVNKVNVLSNNTLELNVEEEGKTKGQLKYTLGEGFTILTEKNVALTIRDDEDKELTTVSYKNGVGFEYKDEFENEIKCTDGLIELISKKINHNSGKEPMVLGDTLKSILNDLLTAIQKLTVITPVGTSSVPVNIADFIKIQSQLETIKSKKSNLE